MFMPFIATENLQVFLAPQTFHFKIIMLTVPGEGYSKNASCALNVISTVLFLSICPYHGWCTISHQEYHPHRSQCKLTTFVIRYTDCNIIINTTANDDTHSKIVKHSTRIRLFTTIKIMTGARFLMIRI